MPEQNLVVARYQNGEVVKGYTQDFFPERPLFHVQPKGGSQAVPVRMSELKAVFFVKDLLGNRLRTKNRRFIPGDPGPQQGKRIAVHFKDGELIVGHALTFTPGKQGFFVFPSDAQGNNIRIYVLTAAVKEVKLGPAAEQLALTVPRPKPKPPKAG